MNNTQAQAPVMTNAQALLDVKKRLNIADSEWNARSSEQVLYVGNFAVLQAGIIQWQGLSAITRDGVYYKIRFMQGKQLRQDVDANFRAQSGMWWGKHHFYFGYVYNLNLVDTLKAGGAHNVRLIAKAEAESNIPQGVTLVKTPPPVSVNAHMQGSVVNNTTVSDLPVGVTLNQQGRPVWDRSSGDKFGRFVSNDDLARLRAEQGISITPAQQVSAPRKAIPVAAQASEKMSFTEYELGAYVAMLDDDRDLGEQPYPDDASGEWMDGYASYFTPEEEPVDERVIDAIALMQNMARVQSEQMAQQQAAQAAAQKATQEQFAAMQAQQAEMMASLASLLRK